MASIFRNIVHGQEYGNEGKKVWTKCGTLIEKDGRFFVKLSYIPLVPTDGDGIFLSVFGQDHNKREEKVSKDSGSFPDEDLSDDIPF